MKYALKWLLLVIFVSAGIASGAEDEALLARLDQALTAVPGFEHGQDSAPLVEIEQFVFALAPDSPLRGPVEERLLETLRSATTRDAKAFLCQQLHVVGTQKSISVLEELLTDPDAAHPARIVLGRLEHPAALEALHRALQKTSGKLQAGIVHTLADRRHRAAGPDCARLLASSDPDVALAAARALGFFGGDQSVRVLREARTTATGPLAAEIDNGLLNSASQLAAAGQAAEAAAIYESFYQADQPRQLRSAGLRGLVMTQPDKAASLLVDAIGQQDQELARYAISLVKKVPGPEATSALVRVLESLPSEHQVLMLRALGIRGDTTASRAIAKVAGSEDQDVRIAALEALGSVGEPASLAILIRAAATGGREQEVARRSLLLLPGRETDRHLMQAMSDGTDAERIEVFRALAGRGVSAAVGGLFQAAGDQNAELAQAAITALGTLAAPDDTARLVQLAASVRGPQQTTAVVEAAEKAFRRLADPDGSAAAVLKQLESTPVDTRPVLIRLLGKTTADAALERLRAAAKESDPAMRQSAIEALADWPDGRAADDLLGLIVSADRREWKERALQGYLRLAMASDDPTAMTMRVMQRVTQTNDKKLVLAGLGLTAESPEALQVALRHLDDEPLQATAGLAALRIAHRLQHRDGDLARAALKRVLEIVEHEDVRGRAQEVLNDMDRYQDHILTWVGVGPYSENGKDGSVIYRTPFGPEKDGVESVDWKPITEGIGSWDINLEATYGGLDHIGAYVRTRVWSEDDGDALLEMGSDDGIKAWLNGQLVFDQWNEGGVSPRQKRVPVKLAKGWNDLMLKVVDQQGGWAFCCRIRKPDGTAMEGLRVELP